MIDQVHEKYPNDVKIVIKNFPLSSHRQARKAALYALAAEQQGKYYEMYKKIFANYRGLKKDEDLPIQYAVELGLDIDQLKKDLENPELIQRIAIEINQLKKSGMRMAVPKFLINGVEPKKRNLASFSAAIDEILKGN